VALTHFNVISATVTQFTATLDPLPPASTPSDYADDCSRTRLRSASSNKLVLRRSRLSTAGDRAFCVAAPRLWNSLPARVTSAKTLPTFKKHLKTELFNQSYNL